MENCKGKDCATVNGDHSVACRYEYALARLGLTDTPEMRVLFWDANNALIWDEATDQYTTPDPVDQVAQDKALVALLKMSKDDISAGRTSTLEETLQHLDGKQQ